MLIKSKMYKTDHNVSNNQINITLFLLVFYSPYHDTKTIFAIMCCNNFPCIAGIKSKFEQKYKGCHNNLF